MKLKTEVPEDMKLQKRAEKILLQLEKSGAVYFQTDDGPDDYELVEQLRQIAGDVGYDLVNVDKGYVWVIFCPEDIEEKAAKKARAAYCSI